MAQHNTLNVRLKDLQFFRGFGPLLLKNHIFLSFCKVGGLDPLPPLSGSAHDLIRLNTFYCICIQRDWTQVITFIYGGYFYYEDRRKS